MAPDTDLLETTIRDAGRIVGDMSTAQASWDDVSELSDVDLASNLIFWREHREAITHKKDGGRGTIRALETEWEKRHG